MITAGSLFSGIGGIDLAMSLAGFDIRWQVEIDDFCREVLAKHSWEYWRNAKQFTDVRYVTARSGDERSEYQQLEKVDVLFGGFPCQDISISGKRAGIRDGTRSGLWGEFRRIISEIRPKAILLENVPNITRIDGTTVIADLAAMGYDARWGIISAENAGAPHVRERWWCVAFPMGYTNRQRHLQPPTADRAYRDEKRHDTPCEQTGDNQLYPAVRNGEMEHPNSQRLQKLEIVPKPSNENLIAGGYGTAEPAARRDAHESGLGRNAYGLPARMDGHRLMALEYPAPPNQNQHEWEPDYIAPKNAYTKPRLKALGNAVVPQVVFPLAVELYQILKTQFLSGSYKGESIMSETIDLEPSVIRTDGGTQARAELNNETVQDYTEIYAAGGELPAVKAHFDGENYWLDDGFHRLQAAKNAKKTTIRVEVRQGTQRDAILASTGANADHGLRRTNADKRRAVLRLLNDDEWGKWSDHEIARHTKVSNKTVGNIRRELSVENSQMGLPTQTRMVKRGDSTYEMTIPTGKPKELIITNEGDKDSTTKPNVTLLKSLHSWNNAVGPAQAAHLATKAQSQEQTAAALVELVKAGYAATVQSIADDGVKTACVITRAGCDLLKLPFPAKIEQEPAAETPAASPTPRFVVGDKAVSPVGAIITILEINGRFVKGEGRNGVRSYYMEDLRGVEAAPIVHEILQVGNTVEIVGKGKFREGAQGIIKEIDYSADPVEFRVAILTPSGTESVAQAKYVGADLRLIKPEHQQHRFSMGELALYDGMLVAVTYIYNEDIAISLLDSGGYICAIDMRVPASELKLVPRSEIADYPPHPFKVGDKVVVTRGDTDDFGKTLIITSIGKGNSSAQAPSIRVAPDGLNAKSSNYNYYPHELELVVEDANQKGDACPDCGGNLWAAGASSMIDGVSYCIDCGLKRMPARPEQPLYPYTDETPIEREHGNPEPTDELTIEEAMGWLMGFDLYGQTSPRMQEYIKFAREWLDDIEDAIVEGESEATLALEQKEAYQAAQQPHNQNANRKN